MREFLAGRTGAFVMAEMDARQVGRHPEFPRLVWAVVEQPPGEEYRLRYHPEDGSFRRTQWKNLAYVRGFTGAYGWIGSLGTPPDRHCDVIIITRQQLRPGAVALAHPCGIFYRSDGDHKVAALDDALRPTVEMRGSISGALRARIATLCSPIVPTTWSKNERNLVSGPCSFRLVEQGVGAHCMRPRLLPGRMHPSHFAGTPLRTPPTGQLHDPMTPELAKDRYGYALRWA